MITTSTLQSGELRHHQNKGLYRGIQMSALATLIASVILMITLQGKYDFTCGLIWCFVINLIYVARCIDSYLFSKSTDPQSRPEHWQRRFDIGVILGALAWGSAIWMLFPIGYPASKALLVLSVCAISGGAMASLASDRRAFLLFQICLCFGVVSRLLLDGTPDSMSLALFSFVIFALVISTGIKLSKTFVQTMRWHLESKKSNLTLMKTSEQMAGMGYWSWVSGAKHIELSNNLARLLMLDRCVLSSDEFFDLIGDTDRQRVESLMKNQLNEEADEEIKIEFQLNATDSGSVRHLRQISRRLVSNDDNCLFGSVQEITDIKQAQDKIYRMAYQDALTGLANRTSFYEQLDQALSTARSTNSELAVLYIDVDDFKGVNDYYGHNHGDEYLVKLAEHLRSSIGKSHLIARLGGDEFCVIITGDSVTQLDSVTSGIFDFCAGKIPILGQLIQPKLSVGVALFPQHGTTSAGLVSNADLAMYDAKRNNTGRAIFESAMAESRTAQLELENGLREALQQKSFELWYQPKVDTKTGSIAGVEALIRWRGRDGQLISPAVFIPVAEHAGLIKDIGDWVLETACEQLKAWSLAGYSLQMAINVSGDHFSNDEFVSNVGKAIANFEIEAANLEIEITESLSRDPEVHRRICEALRKLGVKIAIDDFGTGYSSLSVLGQLGVDTLKIDQSFIANLPEDETSCLMVKKITELALGLGYEIVAEGVETQEQLVFLQGIGCPYMQGYYFSRPLPAAQITNMLRDEFLGHNQEIDKLISPDRASQPSAARN